MEGGRESWSRFLLLWVTWSVLIQPATGKPPHIVFIVADDLGWNDVGWHNPNMYTPNLDKLALHGVRLNSSYVQQVCTPSRNCFMSGYYPYHTGLQHQVIHPTLPSFMPANLTTLSQKLKQLGYATHIVGNFFTCEPDDFTTEVENSWLYYTYGRQHGVIFANRPSFMPGTITTLPQKLKEQGYATHIVGKWHLGFCNWKYTPTYRGFDSFMGYYVGAEDYYTHRRDDGYDFRLNTSVYNNVKGEYSANVIARRAIDLINSVDPETQPLYLYLPFQSVHAPLEVPERYKNLPPYKHIQHEKRKTYCGMVSALDEAVGNITDALYKRGFMKNTLIVFTTDNGGPTYEAANNLPLRGAKATLWEGGTKGAAFVYSDTLLKKTNYTNTELIHAVDWYPTLLSVAGGTPDPAMDGKNQWPMISDGQPSARKEFVYNIDQLSNCSAIRVGKYKLMQGNPGAHNGWAPVPNSASDEEVLKYRGHEKFPPYMLYDIEADPTEHFDIAEKYPEIVEDMKKKLEKYMESLVPANFPAPDPKSDPKHFGGNWSPGWC